MNALSLTRLTACLCLLAAAPQRAIAYDDSPLSANMEAIGDAFKPLYRSLMDGPDSDRVEQYLAWTRTIKTEAVKARDHAPSMTEKMSAADQDTLVKDYQADMDAFIKQVEALEKALVAGNLIEAQALARKLKGARRDGHGKYQEEEE